MFSRLATTLTRHARATVTPLTGKDPIPFSSRSLFCQCPPFVSPKGEEFPIEGGVRAIVQSSQGGELEDWGYHSGMASGRLEAELYQYGLYSDSITSFHQALYGEYRFVA